MESLVVQCEWMEDEGWWHPRQASPEDRLLSHIQCYQACLERGSAPFIGTALKLGLENSRWRGQLVWQIWAPAKVSASKSKLDIMSGTGGWLAGREETEWKSMWIWDLEVWFVTNEWQLKTSLLGSEDGLGGVWENPVWGTPVLLPCGDEERGSGWRPFLWAQSLFLLGWPMSGFWNWGLGNQSAEKWKEGTATHLLEGYLQGKECKWTQCQLCPSSRHPWAGVTMKSFFLTQISREYQAVYQGQVPPCTQPVPWGHPCSNLPPISSRFLLICLWEVSVGWLCMGSALSPSQQYLPRVPSCWGSSGCQDTSYANNYLGSFDFISHGLWSLLRGWGHWAQIPAPQSPESTLWISPSSPQGFEQLISKER